MENLDSLSLKLLIAYILPILYLMAWLTTMKFLCKCAFQVPSHCKFILSPKCIYYCDIHIRTCLEIFVYPLFYFLQTFNFFHSMIGFIRIKKFFFIIYSYF